MITRHHFLSHLGGALSWVPGSAQSPATLAVLVAAATLAARIHCRSGGVAPPCDCIPLAKDQHGRSSHSPGTTGHPRYNATPWLPDSPHTPPRANSTPMGWIRRERD